MATNKKTESALPRTIVNQAWIIVLGAIAPMLDSTMVNIALNKLSSDFNEALSTVQWVVTGYLLAMVVAVPFTGWLNDKIGGKKVFLIAEVLFGLSSLVAAMSGNVTMLISIRFVQGFSAGLITPLLTTLLVDVAGVGSMGRIMAIVGLPIMLGPLWSCDWGRDRPVSIMALDLFRQCSRCYHCHNSHLGEVASNYP